MNEFSPLKDDEDEAKEDTQEGAGEASGDASDATGATATEATEESKDDKSERLLNGFIKIHSIHFHLFKLEKEFQWMSECRTCMNAFSFYLKIFLLHDTALDSGMKVPRAKRRPRSERDCNVRQDK